MVYKYTRWGTIIHKTSKINPMGYNMTDEEIKKCDSDLYQQYINEKLKEDIPDVLKDIFK